MTTEALKELLAKVEVAKVPDRELDAEVWWHLSGSRLIRPLDRRRAENHGVPATLDGMFSFGWRNSESDVPGYTTSIDAALALVERVLPNFWVSSGLCALTGHASMGPDYNGPAGDELRKLWPEDPFDAGFHADLAPGDGRHRQCFAILHCALQALIAKALLAQGGDHA